MGGEEGKKEEDTRAHSFQHIRIIASTQSNVLTYLVTITNGFNHDPS